MRVLIKGGIWRNTEDEILKAAVMKYGKNQWARIASLMPKKSAKQCKDRWYSWLDPSIKKTEWSREEEEKLLHLAKILPTQWRSIAPRIPGRTPAQCLEHYEKLLYHALSLMLYLMRSDQAAGIGSDDEDDPRRLRPGEIDPNPEAKPARPDAINMEDDEKEMLQEARARFANTKGKKAKRKAREKQLEQARRLASLQRRRELKAAGMGGGGRRRVRYGQIDYMAEIPFLHEPKAGFFSTTAENERERKERADAKFQPKLLAQLEKRSRDQVDKEHRRKDINELKGRIQKGETLEEIKAKQDALIKRRSNLVMPAPQMSDAEMKELTKLGADADLGLEGGMDATRALLTDYSATPSVRGGAGSATPAPPVARTPARANTLMQEAQNLRALTNAENPLLPGENAFLHDSDFSSATPARSSSATANPLATPLRTPGMTPATFGETPRRDQLGINSDGFAEESVPKMFDLKSAFAALPKPKEYQVALPDDLDDAMDIDFDENADDSDRGTAVVIPDMRDIAEAQRKAAEAAMAKELRSRSSVLQRDLPRPFSVNENFGLSGNQYSDSNAKESELVSDASSMIKAEMVLMMRWDAMNYPVPKRVAAPAPAVARETKSSFRKYEEKDLARARHLLQREVEKVKEDIGEISLVDYADTWEDLYKDLVYLPNSKKYSPLSMVKSDKEKIDAMKFEFGTVHEQFQSQAKRAAGLARKVDQLHKGYIMIADKTSKEIETLRDELEAARIERKSFEALRALEQDAIPTRVGEIESVIATMREIEASYQQQYAQLVREKASFYEQRSNGSANGAGAMEVDG